jgi:branched-chain amino acid transport system ATP-binding protein
LAKAKYPMTTDILLSVANLQAGYGESKVLFDVSFDIARGEVVTLLGRNGMGKTTTISAIMGLVRPRAGSIQFDGQAVAGLAAYQIARRGIGLVPEGRQIFPNLTVTENLIATATDRSNGSEHWTLGRIFELFPALKQRQTSFGAVLSGGEQQMLAIGRALMTNPKLLILDEATEGLAPLIRGEIWRVLKRLRALGQAILIIDKNLAALTKIASRHCIIEKGRTVWSGGSVELQNNRRVQERYLGI